MVKVRQVAMYLLRNELGLSFVEIGNLLGGRDHTTIMHGVDKIQDMIDKKIFTDDMEQIRSFPRSLSFLKFFNISYPFFIHRLSTL